MKKLLLLLLCVPLIGFGQCISGDCENGYGTYIWDSGNKYVGEWKDGLAHGLATMTYASGSKYIGEWKDGFFYGEGTYIYASGDKYVGEWKVDKKDGEGTLTWANGNKYVGEWKDGKKDGQGTMTYASGNKYVGEWKDGFFYGEGTYYASGNKYVGEWKRALKDGQGTMTYASGNKYVGEWKDDLLHGQGTYTFVSGNKYVGEWKDGKQHGQGTYTIVSGNKYVGEWKDGKQHGQGTMTWVGGNKYVGEYKDGKIHGEGTSIWQSGEIYIGEFKNGRYYGLGVMIFADGSKYIGEWKDNRRNGEGTGTLVNGDKYVGEWKNGKHHGQGTYTYVDGSVEKGLWENDEFLEMISPQNTTIEAEIQYFGFGQDQPNEGKYSFELPKINITLLNQNYLDYKVDFSIDDLGYINIRNLPNIDTLLLEFSCDECYTLRQEFITRNFFKWNPEKSIEDAKIHIVDSSLKIIENFNYLVYYSEEYQQPIYMSYYLKKGKKLDKKRKEFRNQSIFLVKNKIYYHHAKFAEDTAVIVQIKTSNYDDYKNTVYDRGHLASVRAFANYKDDYYINSYLNCVLMNETLNSGVWNLIEEEEVKLNQDNEKQVFVEIFVSFSEDTVLGGATIPSFFFKKIYVYDQMPDQNGYMWKTENDFLLHNDIPRKHSNFLNNDSSIVITRPSRFNPPPDSIPVIYGCMDDTMFNYNAAANINDGSCYPEGYTSLSWEYAFQNGSSGTLMSNWEYFNNYYFFKLPGEYHKSTLHSDWEMKIAKHAIELFNNSMTYE